jgi:LIVCS family branched-chain amino acid:cation transporter
MKCIVAGSAIFSMLFGSGNIVFPLMLGRTWGGDWFIPLVGWLIAAAAVPMLGFYIAMLYNGNRDELLAPIGKYCTFGLMLIVMSLIGPFGILARAVNVSFGGFIPLLPNLPLWGFSAIYITLFVLCGLRPDKVVSMIGIIFTPLKFGGLTAVIVAAMYVGGKIPGSTGTALVSDQFINGFNMGYQTMDLLFALITGGSIYSYVQNALPEKDRSDKAKLLKMTGIACAIGTVLLTVAYMGLMILAAQYSDQLAGVPDASLFGKITELALGSNAAWFTAIVVAVSCFATCIILGTVFTDFVHKDILRERFSRGAILAFTGVFAFTVSLLGFAKVCAFINMIVEKLYPLLMIFMAGRMVYYYAVVSKKK